MGKAKNSCRHSPEIAIPRSLSDGSRVVKRLTERGRCILETASGAAIARFHSERLLDEWCRRLEESRGIKLEIITFSGDRKQKKPTPPPKVFNGVAIPLSIRTTKHFVKYKLRNSWALTTLSGNHVAHFPTEGHVDNWWRQFLKSGWAAADASLSYRGEDGVVRNDARSTKVQASPPITQAVKDRFAEAMLFAFLEFHPRYRSKDISLADFHLVLKSCFSKSFVNQSLSAMAKSKPMDGEADCISWVYHQFDGFRTPNTRSLKDSFNAVALLLAEVIANRRAAFRASYEHRPVGRGRPGGRWGS